MKDDHPRKIKEILIKNGASLVGFADLRKIDLPFYDDINIGISIAVALNPHIVNKIINNPDIGYYKEYTKVNELLGILGEIAAAYLIKNGYKVIVFPPSSSNVKDLVDLSTPLPHKTVATRAGLGWIGRTALLVTDQYGSAIRLTSVLSNADFDLTFNPVDRSKCSDDCKICVEECPCQASTGDKWNKNIVRSDFFDAYKCYKTALKKGNNIGINIPICGKCIAVCPNTRKYLDREMH